MHLSNWGVARKLRISRSVEAFHVVEMCWDGLLESGAQVLRVYWEWGTGGRGVNGLSISVVALKTWFQLTKRANEFASWRMGWRPMERLCWTSSVIRFSLWIRVVGRSRDLNSLIIAFQVVAWIFYEMRYTHFLPSDIWAMTAHEYLPSTQQLTLTPWWHLKGRPQEVHSLFRPTYIL